MSLEYDLCCGGISSGGPSHWERNILDKPLTKEDDGGKTCSRERLSQNVKPKLFVQKFVLLQQINIDSVEIQ